MDINEKQRNELYLYLHTNQTARKKSHFDTSNVWEAGFYAGYITAMENVLEIFNLQNEFQKWSEKHEKNKNS